MIFLLITILATMLIPGEPESVADKTAADEAALGEEAYYSIRPRHYICNKTVAPPQIDGRLDSDIWDRAAWTADFTDIEGEGKPPPRYRTRVKMLWDDSCLYVFAEMEEPHVWGTITKRDAVIFHDNDFEIFLDPSGDNHNYYELEINALGTVWDLFLDKPYRDRGQADNSWNIRELRTAVHTHGSLNDPSDKDMGWCVEMALPWESFDRDLGEKLPKGPIIASSGNISWRPAIPKAGSQWRVNFSRVEWRHEIRSDQYWKHNGHKEANWVWSPQGVIDMHRPEKWGYLQFTDGVDGAEFKEDTVYEGKMKLLRLYYAQKAHYKKHRKYAGDFSALQLDPWQYKFNGSYPVLKLGNDLYDISYSWTRANIDPDETLCVEIETTLGISADSRIRHFTICFGEPLHPQH